MNNEAKPEGPSKARGFALEFSIALIAAVGAFLSKNHILGIDLGGGIYLKCLIVAIGMTIWIALRFLFAVRE